MLYNVKAGILGLDDLGEKYADLLKEHIKNISLIAACGRTQKELLYAKNTLSLEYVYGDEKQIIENHDVDALFIFSEAHLRANLAIQAIEKGKHVFMINPIALNVEDAEAVRKTAESHPSQTVMCGSNIRASVILSELKDILKQDKLGDVKMVEISSNFMNSINKLHAKASGSKYLDGMLDEIELCNWLFGDNVESVEVRDKKSLKICDAYFEDGKEIRYLARFDSDSEYGSLKIETSKASICLNSKDRNHIDIYYTDGSWERHELNHGHTVQLPEYIQLQHFTNSILNKEKKGLGLASAVKGMELALAFEKSDVLGNPVTLDKS